MMPLNSLLGAGGFGGFGAQPMPWGSQPPLWGGGGLYGAGMMPPMPGGGWGGGAEPAWGANPPQWAGGGAMPFHGTPAQPVTPSQNVIDPVHGTPAYPVGAGGVAQPITPVRRPFGFGPQMPLRSLM